MYRSEEQIKKDMLNNIQNTTDKTQNSLVHDAISAASLELANFYLDLESVENKLDIENLSDGELEQFVYQRTGIIRKPATKSTTIVTIIGQEAVRIYKGDLVASDTVNFIALDDAIVDITGQILVEVECELAGTIGNVPAGAIRYFPTTIPGLVSVSNQETVTNGYDAESDFDLIQRYYERIRTPATAGNKYHYLNWAKEVVGVGDARVAPLWAGDNTVKVVIIDSNKQPASSDLVDDVQDYIDPNISGLGEGQAPIGAFCTVSSATGKAIDIIFTVSKDSNYTLEQVQTNVENNIIEYLKSIAFKEDIVSYARIGAIILDSDGVLDYEGLAINSGTSNITVDYEEVTILGEVIINE